MNPREAARHFAASLIEARLARARVEGPDGALTQNRGGLFGEPIPLSCGVAPARMVHETFEDAPPAVAAWLAGASEDDREVLAEEMARLAEALRISEAHFDILIDALHKYAARKNWGRVLVDYHKSHYVSAEWLGTDDRSDGAEGPHIARAALAQIGRPSTEDDR